MKILIVDDNASLARGLKNFLEEETHECLIAGNVRDGIDLIKANYIFNSVQRPIQILKSGL